MLTYLLQGLTLGLTAGAQPGPLQTYLISQSLQNGWRRSLLAAFAPLVSDGPIVALVLLVLSQVPSWLQRALYIGGGLFILYLAWSAYRQWRQFQSERELAAQSQVHSLFRAATMNILNPAPYIFWSLVNGPILLRAWNETPANGLNFLGGFYGSMVGVNVAIVLVFGLASRAGDRLRRVMLGISALVLAAFGLFQLWQGFQQ
jgi:threonine/homoserine/homoserine lactone efflux protein